MRGFQFALAAFALMTCQSGRGEAEVLTFDCHNIAGDVGPPLDPHAHMTLDTVTKVVTADHLVARFKNRKPLVGQMTGADRMTRRLARALPDVSDGRGDTATLDATLAVGIASGADALAVVPTAVT